MVAKHDHDALPLGSTWVEELMDGWIRAGRQLLIGLVQNETQEKGFCQHRGDGDRSLRLEMCFSVLLLIARRVAARLTGHSASPHAHAIEGVWERVARSMQPGPEW